MHALTNTLLVGYLLAVAVIDSLRSRIPNALTVSAAVAGLLLGTIASGAGGLLAATEGLLVGFFLFLPLYLLGGFGAGDVKAVAAAGSFLGPQGALVAVFCTLIAGGIAGLAVLLTAGGMPALRSMLSRWALLMYVPSAARPLAAQADPSNAAPKLRFPYGVAIACGVIASLLLG